MSAFTSLLSSFRQAAASEREKGTYFEELTLAYQAASTQMQAVKFVEKDEQKIAWDDKLFQGVASDKAISYSEQAIVKASYRPFAPMYFYFDRSCIWSPYQMPKIFPNCDAKNLVILTTGRGSTKEFCAFISDRIPDLEMISKGQCFPLYLYDEPAKASQPGLFEEGPPQSTRRDGITNQGLAHFQAAYPGENLTKEALFYYIYGLLHSPEYCASYADNLCKELPRIPCVKTTEDFWIFSKAGRALAALHLNFESVPMHPVEVVTSGPVSDASYRVEKMRYGKAKEDGKTVDDKTMLVYNDQITLKGIPLEAYAYVVNGKSALDWVVERQCVKTDKDSGIVNDANAWATETMGNPKYPLELFQRVITVSLETMKIVNALPPMAL